MLVNVSLHDTFWTTEHFVVKLGTIMRHHKPECHAEKLFHCLQCQGHREGLNNLNMTTTAVSSKLLVCLQPNLVCCSTASEGRVSCGKIWLLRSKSVSQRRFSMSVNVCPDDIFWTTEHFVTKLGMFMQHHEPECHAEKLVHCLQCQGYSEGLYNQNITFCYLFWTAGLFATKIGLIVQS